MKIAGVICEYNPFHSGHGYHLTETRSRLGDESSVVCVMSGNFVQRGEAALFPKHVRAAAAVKGGADLVLELPLPWAVAGAEKFACGGVSLLKDLGICTHLSFGSESGSIEDIKACVNALNLPETDRLIVENLELGLPYAEARQRAVTAVLGPTADRLRDPNDNLAVAYLLAAEKLAAPLEPMVIRRLGAGHDQPTDGRTASAAHIRQCVRNGEAISPQLWDRTPFEASVQNGTGPVFTDAFETAILARLRLLPREAFTALPDISEGLDDRFYAAVRSEPTVEALLDAVKSKRTSMARLRRILLCAFLGVTESDSQGPPPYIRVLAFNDRGRELLRLIKENGRLPIITKPTEIRGLDERCRRLFELEAAADDLYVLGCPDPQKRAGGTEWTTSPCYIK